MIGYLLAAFVLASATWYGGPQFDEKEMRNGQPYNSLAATCAVGVTPGGAPVLEMGSLLLVCRAQEAGRPPLDGSVPCVVAEVTDTGYLPEGDLDLTPAVFSQLGHLDEGRIEIQWTVLR